MNLETILNFWHIAPVRWAVYMAVALYVLYVITAYVWGRFERDGIQWWERVLILPLAIPLAIVDVAFNWLISLLWREGPHDWNETFTQRLQRTLDNPGEYAGYRLALAHWLKPILNRHDDDHLE